MFVNKIILASNPFIDAYMHSDFLGKFIFLGLIALSIGCWILLLYKWWLAYHAKKNAASFYKAFTLQKANPLNLECNDADMAKAPHPFRDLYLVFKKQTVDILNKNRVYGNKKSDVSFLSPSDIDYVEAHLFTTVASQIKYLEKNLFILATIVTLAPFLGLLGTVWGILTTFSELQMNVGGSTHQMVLGGLSLALATTVLGLLDAIPALIGYNYLKNSIRDFQTEMEGFSNEILACVEMQYRKVDVHE